MPILRALLLLLIVYHSLINAVTLDIVLAPSFLFVYGAGGVSAFRAVSYLAIFFTLLWASLFYPFKFHFHVKHTMPRIQTRITH